MNGREILNAVNFAKTIAKDELRELKLEHLEMVLKVWADSKIIEEREVKGDEIVVKLVMPSRIRAWAVVVLGAAVLLSLLLGPLRTTEFE
jgi:hypothetical protein